MNEEKISFGEGGSDQRVLPKNDDDDDGSLIEGGAGRGGCKGLLFRSQHRTRRTTEGTPESSRM